MENKESFFGSVQPQSALTKMYSRISGAVANNDFEKARNGYIALILNGMLKNPEEWDTNCRINIEWIGNQFISRIADESESLDKKMLDGIFSFCFRFLFELYLSIKNDLSIDFERARNLHLRGLMSSI